MEAQCIFESKLMDGEEEDPTAWVWTDRHKAMLKGHGSAAEEVRIKASDAAEGSQLLKVPRGRACPDFRNNEKLSKRLQAAKTDAGMKESGSKVGKTELSSTKSPTAADVEDARRRHQLAAMSLYGEFAEQQTDEADLAEIRANGYRSFWNHLWADEFSSFQDTTYIPPMLYTDDREPRFSAGCMHTLQVFSIKIADVKYCSDGPLSVFGLVAARDSLDHKRNIIFSCTRDNCQTVTLEDPYLKLTGPVRAIVVLDPVSFEVDLKVKGLVEHEDTNLSFLVVPYNSYATETRSSVVKRVGKSKICTLEFTLGHIVHSVEATIFVRVISGSWPHGFAGSFTVSTASIGDMKVSNSASLEMSLLAFEDGKMPVASNGKIDLSRHVTCVELEGELKVSAVAEFCYKGRAVVERDGKTFKPKERGRSSDILKVGSCEIEVTIAWSLLSSCPFPQGTAGAVI